MKQLYITTTRLKKFIRTFQKRSSVYAYLETTKRKIHSTTLTNYNIQAMLPLLQRLRLKALTVFIGFCLAFAPNLMQAQTPIWVVDEHPTANVGLHLWQYSNYNSSSGIDYGRLKYKLPGSSTTYDLAVAGDMEAMAVNTYTGIAYFLSNDQVTGGPSGTQALFQYDLLQAPSNVGNIVIELIGHITKPTSSNAKMECLAYDPTSNRFYTADPRDNDQNSSSSTDILYYVDMSSLNANPMQATSPIQVGLIQGLGKYNKYVDGLECDDNGNLYAIDGVKDELHRINPITGAILQVVDNNIGGDYETISWDAVNSKMIGVDNSGHRFAQITFQNGNNINLASFPHSNNEDFEGSAMLNINGPKMSIGNLVWTDNNGNGSYNSGEGIDGVEVELYLAGANPQTSIPIHTVTTSGGGFYNFTTLVADSYFVHIPKEEFGNGQPLKDYVSLTGVGADNGVDNDDNGIDAVSPTVTGVSTHVVTLSNNGEPTNGGTETGAGNSLDDSDDNNGDMTIDFAFLSTLQPPNPQPTDWSYACADGKHVEVIGKGTEGQTNTTLVFTNTSTIDQIVVEAIHKNGTPPSSMTFMNNLGQTIIATKQDVYNAGGSVQSNVAAYRAVFPASSSITLTTPSPSTTWSMVAYIHRNNATNTFSSGRYVSTYFYRTSKTETIPMPATVGNKTVEIIIPITELNFDSRIATVTASAGGVSQTFTVQQPNLGTSLNIQTLTLNNVPGSATSLSLTVTSPDSNGDSFTAGGALTVNYTCPTAENCTNGIDDDNDGLVDCADPDCAPNITNVNLSHPSCPSGTNDGTITITATAGSSGGSLEYSINGGASWQASNVFFGQAPNSYNVQVRDLAAGCTASWVNNPVVLLAPNCVCSPSETKTLVEWKIGSCAYDSDYSEFTPNIPSGVNCAITASTIHRNSGSHSCNGGRPNNPDNKAFCVASFNNSATSFDPTDSKAIRFTVSMPNNTVGSLTNFKFWTAAGRSGSSADFGLAVYKDGVLIHQDLTHDVTTTWTLEEFNLSVDPDFVYTGGETFEFVMIPYNISGTTSFLWELDEFSVDGCCGPASPPPSSCSATDLKKLIQWDVATCQAFSGAYDYSEFVASVPAGLDCQLSGTNLYRDNPNTNHHSCNPGRAAGDGYAFCIGGFNDANYISGSQKALKFKVTIPSLSSGSIYKLNFWGVGQNPTPYIGASSANNNYPTKYGVRVLKDGTEIYEQSGFGIEQIWTLEEVFFGNDPNFSYTGGEEFEFQLFAYSPIGNGYSISVWDLDEFSLTGCCASTVVCGSITNVQTTDPSNCGVSDGNIVVTASGYSGTLQYSKDGGLNWQNSNTFNNLSAGNYNIAVRNSDGSCITQYPNNPVVLTAPTSPVVSSVQATDPTECGVCDGTITISASGGSGSYQFSVDNGSTWQSSGSFTGLCGNTYNPRVRNADGTCVIIGAPIVLIAPTFPTISGVVATDPIECGQNTGTITVTATGNGPLQYSIDNGANWQPSNLFVNLSPGNYQVKVRNATGSCSVTYGNNPVVINQKNPPVISNIQTTNPSDCGMSDGSIVITASGSYTTIEYSIDNGLTWQSSNTFSSLSGATYFVLVRYTDETCQVSGGTVTLTSPSAPVIQNVQYTDPTDCNVNDGTITIIATSSTSNLEYSIDGGSNWSTNSGFSNLSAGTYQIRVRNISGSCEVSYPDIILTAPTSPTINSIAGTDPTDCGLTDGTITISAHHPSQPLEYSIDGGVSWQSSNIFINLSGGTYNVRVRILGGSCVIMGGNIVLTDKIAPSNITVTSSNPTNCGTTDGQICVTATGSAIEYSINGGANWQKQTCFDNLSAGTYTVLIRNCDGTCEVAYVNNPVVLTAPNAPTVTSTSSTDPTDCAVTDGTITVNATGGSGSYEYMITGSNWQSSNQFTGLTGGTYTIKVRNADGTCEVMGGVEILEDKVSPVWGSTVITDPTNCGVSRRYDFYLRIGRRRIDVFNRRRSKLSTV